MEELVDQEQMSEELKHEFETLIKHAIPTIKESLVAETIKLFWLEGVRTKDDLKYVTPAMLQTVNMPRIFARKLMEAIDTVTQGPSTQRPQQHSGAPTMHNLQQEVMVHATPKMPTFTVDSPELVNVKEALLKNERPTEANRRMMVYNIVEKCKRVVPGLGKTMFAQVSRQLVEMYPLSFKDRIEDPVKHPAGDGTLLFQLKTRFDNSNRGKNQTTMQKKAPNTTQAFGCIEWNPALPEGETEEMLTLARNDMINKYQTQSPRDWKWKTDILMEMRRTYYLQRKDINSQIEPKSKSTEVLEAWRESYVSTDTLVQSWPFLFQPKGMNCHFEQLTGVDMLSSFKSWAEAECRDMLDFLASQHDTCKIIRSNMERAKSENTCAEPDFVALFLSLVRFFNDDIKKFMLKVEHTVELEEIEGTVALPSNPCLILATRGLKWYTYEKVYFAIDSKVLTAVPRFWSGAVSVFMSYFVLNIKYPPGLGKTMEFMQRVMASINPTRGTRCSKDDNPPRIKVALTKFLNKYQLYKQSIEQDIDDPDYN